VSEGCLYAQLVDRFDSDSWDSECQPPFNKDRCSNYAQLFRAVSRALFRAHVQSTLKSEVINEIERFVNFDPDMVAPDALTPTPTPHPNPDPNPHPNPDPNPDPVPYPDH
jgi:hypothetical protein